MVIADRNLLPRTVRQANENESEMVMQLQLFQ